jgi:hypothetical protein
MAPACSRADGTFGTIGLLRSLPFVQLFVDLSLDCAGW